MKKYCENVRGCSFVSVNSRSGTGECNPHSAAKCNFNSLHGGAPWFTMKKGTVTLPPRARNQLPSIPPSMGLMASLVASCLPELPPFCTPCYVMLGMSCYVMLTHARLGPSSLGVASTKAPTQASTKGA